MMLSHIMTAALIIVLIIITSYYLEKESWNKGICKKSGLIWNLHHKTKFGIRCYKDSFENSTYVFFNSDENTIF